MRALRYVLLGLSALALGCASGPREQPALSTATISAVEFEPAPGTVLTRDGVIRARIHYQIEPFHPAATYRVALHFATTEPGVTYTSHSGAGLPGKRITRPEGEITVIFKLADLVARHSPHPLRRPLAVRVAIDQHTGPDGSTIIGHTEFAEYPLSISR